MCPFLLITSQKVVLRKLDRYQAFDDPGPSVLFPTEDLKSALGSTSEKNTREVAEFFLPSSPFISPSLSLTHVSRLKGVDGEPTNSSGVRVGKKYGNPWAGRFIFSDSWVFFDHYLPEKCRLSQPFISAEPAHWPLGLAGRFHPRGVYHPSTDVRFGQPELGFVIREVDSGCKRRSPRLQCERDA